MRAHPVFGDSLIAGLLFMADLSALVGYEKVSPGAIFLVGLLLTVPVAFRRKYPLGSSYVILLGGFLQLMTHGGLEDGLPVRAGDFALAVALYTIVAYAGRSSSKLTTGETISRPSIAPLLIFSTTTSSSLASRTNGAMPAAHRLARANAARKSGPTTSRRTASPITGSSSI